MNNLFGKVFTFTSMGMAFLEPEGKLLDVNPAFCKLLGYPREELIGSSFQELFPAQAGDWEKGDRRMR